MSVNEIELTNKPDLIFFIKLTLVPQGCSRYSNVSKKNLTVSLNFFEWFHSKHRVKYLDTPNLALKPNILIEHYFFIDKLAPPPKKKIRVSFQYILSLQQ